MEGVECLFRRGEDGVDLLLRDIADVGGTESLDGSTAAKLASFSYRPRKARARHGAEPGCLERLDVSEGELTRVLALGEERLRAQQGPEIGEPDEGLFEERRRGR